MLSIGLVIHDCVVGNIRDTLSQVSTNWTEWTFPFKIQKTHEIQLAVLNVLIRKFEFGLLVDARCYQKVS